MDIKKIKKISIFLSIYLLCCILIDIFLSWNYFNVNSINFILLESNREIVQFLDNGKIPVFTILAYLFVLLYIGFGSFFFFKSCEKEIMENKQFHRLIMCGQCLFVSTIVFMGLVFISAGSTWYYSPITYVIHKIVLFLTFFLLACSICIFTWLKIKKYFHKEKTKGCIITKWKEYKKQIKKEMTLKKKIFALIIAAIFVFQIGLILIQQSRYQPGGNGHEKFVCVEMSKECEGFFESIGIRVFQMSGRGETKIENDEGGYKTDRHRWILLDFGWFQIPYDSTLLMPWDPRWNGFENVLISEGYVVDGEKREIGGWQPYE